VRAVLDTNVLLSGIFWAGVPGKVVAVWLGGRFEAMATAETLPAFSQRVMPVASPVARRDLRNPHPPPRHDRQGLEDDQGPGGCGSGAGNGLN